MARTLIQSVFVIALALGLAGCSGFNLFGPPKIKEEEIIPPETLYQTALTDIDRKFYSNALDTLLKLERQHPYSEYAEKAKLMTVYINFRRGKFPEAVLGADRYLALYPTSQEVPYILYLKGTSYFFQIKDITRDQQVASDAIDTLNLLVSSFPDSKYVEDARESIRTARDQLAGKEMSVGRYYQGNGQHLAAINRFRVVVEKYQTTTQIEEALFRLTESYLVLGLVSEARTAAAILGHNYPTSEWYKSAYEQLQKQGLTPEIVSGNWIAESAQG
ncbi:MAG: outer membrane protein assembly factor BamD [Alphaproteobacteria bacterium]|nr:outer membrane protein assembly factor BamD [Alphaproteobacteria bacterium]